MRRIAIGVLILAAAACGSTEADPTTTSSVAITTTTVATATTSPTTTIAATTTAGPSGDSGCAHVIGGTIEPGSDGFTVSATVLSTDTGWEKYADAWEVRSPDGVVLGQRILAHPHENEQPFTRSLSQVAIPGDVDEVTLAARDLVLGFCGDVFVMEVPGR